MNDNATNKERLFSNPLAGLDRPKRVLAWGLYDFANQSFTLLIITLLFSLYVQTVLTPQPTITQEQATAIQAAIDTGGALPANLEQLRVDRDAAQAQGKLNWSLMHGGSLLIVVLLSPFVGALSDAKRCRKSFLIGTGIVCGLLTCFLGIFSPGQILLAGVVYAIANISYQIGENFLASFLPQVSTPRTIGRVSAIGWTMGYLGALALLVLTMLLMATLKLKIPDDAEPLFVFAGLWFLIGILPAALILRDEETGTSDSSTGIVSSAVSRVRDTVLHTKRYKHLVRFLLAFLVYGFGVQVIIAFAAILARDFGFKEMQLVAFVAQITVVAGIAAAITSTFQDRIGGRATVLVYLAIWIIATSGLLAVRLIWPDGGPQWPIWVIGNALGFGLGGIGTASRALVARFTPRHRTAEFFGLWGMVYKFAGAVGVLSFGSVSRAFGDVASLVMLLSFFIAGAVLIVRVNEQAGVRAALRAERTEWNL